VTEAWRVFGVELAGRQRLSPSFVRLTFTGADLDRFADNGYDQRFKLILPVPGRPGQFPPSDVDWYAHWRALPDEHRNPIRTYTVRSVRPDRREVDVDVALHGDAGPASRWAAGAPIGERAALVGPDAGYDGVHGGVEFAPGDGVRTVLLAGDETAAPAVMSIVERLPAGTRGEALLEVPHSDDRLPVEAPPWFRVSWLGRDGGEHGSRLTPAVHEAVHRLGLEKAPAEAHGVDESDADSDILWEVPASGPGELYVWLAGEAGVIRGLRRHLVTERGLDRRCVAFMGYWRLGRSEGT
jgi:NADPH-dependent ferric siderophore reductase